jgi:tungstate transport system substrate-binding protein
MASAVYKEKFVAEGFGTKRIPFMYNDFVIVGPADDPAGIRAAKTAADALRAIAAKAAPFVTRGDNSGTHIAEKELWSSAGITPSGAWYRVYEKGSEGNKATLTFADQSAAYTVMDRATFVSARAGLSLIVLVEKDPALLNHITLIPVSPRKFPRINHRGARAFVKWLTSMKSQSLVAEFGKKEVGEPLFFPESDIWQAARKRRK